MNYTPKGSPKRAISLSMLFLMVSVVLFVFSTAWGEILSTVFKTISLVSFGCVFAVISRYLIFSYTYSADDFEFLIYRSSKFSSRVVCRLYYSDITDIEKASEYLKKAKKQKDRPRLYNYCVSTTTKNAYALTYDIGGEVCVLLFEPDRYFLNHLEKDTKNDIPFTTTSAKYPETYSENEFTER